MKSKRPGYVFCRRRESQRGAALLLVLVAVTILGLATGIAGQSWRSLVQRSKEADLLWCGAQYRQAIEGYYHVKQGPKNRYPAKLEDLLKDPRFPQPVRHLRRLYKDPMTGEDWEIIKSPEGGIAGVRSSSTLKPFRQDGFPKEEEAFAKKDSYREWEFVYQPGRTTSKTVKSSTSAASSQ